MGWNLINVGQATQSRNDKIKLSQLVFGAQWVLQHETGASDPTPAGLARDRMERAAAALLNPHSAAQETRAWPCSRQVSANSVWSLTAQNWEPQAGQGHGSGRGGHGFTRYALCSLQVAETNASTPIASSTVIRSPTTYTLTECDGTLWLPLQPEACITVPGATSWYGMMAPSNKPFLDPLWCT